MRDWIRNYFLRRSRLRQLRGEYARTLAHRDALKRLGTPPGTRTATLVLALQHIDLQVAVIEQEMQQMGAELPATAAKSNWLR